MNARQLRSSDLMIGDWVNLGESYNPIQITTIYSGVVEWGSANFEFIVKLKPIQLTAEILEKNGYMNIEGEFYLGLGDYKIMFDKHNKKPSIFKELDADGYFYEIPILDVTYLHELQHALRLFGIEKEFII